VEEGDDDDASGRRIAIAPVPRHRVSMCAMVRAFFSAALGDSRAR